MPNFAANLTMLFNEQPFLERFGAAARNGFKGVEFLFPYEFEPQQVHEQLEKHKLEMVLHNLPAGNWAGGERGIACHPNRIGEFEQGVETALAYASVLETQRINCLVGIKPEGVADADARATLVSNLKFAATALKMAGIPLLNGYAQWYEILAILVGLALLAFEIFVFPGPFVSAIVGIILMLGGCIMSVVP